MTLSLTDISLVGFRGYSSFALEGLPRVTVLVGPNAVGKTNVVEGIQLLTSGESFRKPAWSDVVSWGSPCAVLQGRFCDELRCVEHKLVIEGGARRYEVNGKKKPSTEVRGTCPSVLFIPDHLQMVKAASAARRDAIDYLGGQLSKQYASLKSDYGQVLRQRNLLIKDGLAAGPLFSTWNESLAVNGARLCVNRSRLFARMAKYMSESYARLSSGERLDVAYTPSWRRFDDEGRQVPSPQRFEGNDGLELDLENAQERILEACQRLSGQEQARRTSLAGPHKDDVCLFVNGMNARSFASQGQQRTIVLAWKLAEVRVVEEMTGQKPLLLLDDVMSELDGVRRDALTSFIEESGQALITTTNLGYFNEELLSHAKVVQVPVEGTRIRYEEVSC